MHEGRVLLVARCLKRAIGRRPVLSGWRRQADNCVGPAADDWPAPSAWRNQQRLAFLGIIRRQVPRQFHRVVQDPQDQNAIVIELVSKEVARTANQASLPFPAPSAIAEVISADLWSELRPVKTSHAQRVSQEIAQRDLNDGLVSPAGLDAE